jgi:GntR family transcriptional repressor for pyruvate dehydrogenase complex
MTSAREAAPRQHLRQPRLAEMVASALRERILSGELADGAMLPKQEELLEEFGVSLVPVREALRILETEGLVTVQRGNVGGAVVHRPRSSKVAYMLGMVLQSDQVPLGEVLAALIDLEPNCAAACASRPDRATVVLPKLRAVLDESKAHLDDAAAYTGLARQFHVELVASCGNAAMVHLVGSLEALWTAHVEALARRRESLGSFADDTARRRSLKEHERLYTYIEKGDAKRAAALLAEHYAHPDEPGWGDALDTDMVIRAELVRGL